VRASWNRALRGTSSRLQLPLGTVTGNGDEPTWWDHASLRKCVSDVLSDRCCVALFDEANRTATEASACHARSNRSGLQRSLNCGI
jgi:hypothetical protein